MAELEGREWDGGYRFRPFEVKTTGREFRHSRRQIGREGEKIVPSNISAAWTKNSEETLIGGVLQGRKQFDVKGASRVCKRRMWRLVIEVAAIVGPVVVQRCLSGKTYGDVKGGAVLGVRRKAKEEVRKRALRGWVRNGRENFEVAGVED